MTTADSISLAKRWYHEVWNEGRNETIHELLAPECILHGTDFNLIRGPEEFQTFADNIRSAFPDTKITVEDAFGSGDKVAVRWTMTATHHGDMAGVAASGKPVKINGTSIIQFSDGKVIAGWDNWDRFGLLQQIGAFEPNRPILAETA